MMTVAAPTMDSGSTMFTSGSSHNTNLILTSSQGTNRTRASELDGAADEDDDSGGHGGHGLGLGLGAGHTGVPTPSQRRPPTPQTTFSNTCATFYT